MTKRTPTMSAVFDLYNTARGTPGPLGHNDPAAPFSSLRGRTPGPLGYNDHADPNFTSSHHISSPPAHAIVVTVEQLALLFPGADTGLLQATAHELNLDPAKLGLDSALRLSHFFAQVMEEAGSRLTGRVENLKYSAEALKTTFSYYRNTPGEAEKDAYIRDPQTQRVLKKANEVRIANVAYGGRNGNRGIDSGDGWRYRGRGFIQITGRGNYAAMTRKYAFIYGGDVDFEANPDLVSEFPYVLRSAICFWLENSLPTLADHGHYPDHVDRITAVINRGTKSYGNRRKNFSKAYQAFA